MNNSQLYRVLFLIGRFTLGGICLWSGVDNFLEMDGKAGYTASKGLPNAGIWVLLASSLLLVAGVSIVAGFRPRIGIAALVLFLIPVTVVMHNFWALQGLDSIIELHNFQGNVALIGSALMFLAIPRPWPISVDRMLVTAQPTEPMLQKTKVAP
jgi:putative oxidoreductase